MCAAMLRALVMEDFLSRTGDGLFCEIDHALRDEPTALGSPPESPFASGGSRQSSLLDYAEADTRAASLSVSGMTEPGWYYGFLCRECGAGLPSNAATYHEGD